MERLTEFIQKNKSLCYAIAEENTVKSKNNRPAISKDDEWRKETEQFLYGDYADKLAEYEDLNLTPTQIKEFDGLFLEKCEEVNKLKKELAEYKEGTWIKLPCNVGDAVYFIKSMFSYSKSPMKGAICMIKTFSPAGNFTFVANMESSNQERPFTNSDIGKTVFLTKEEAEAKLRELEGEE